jgi:hypothetical protein
MKCPIICETECNDTQKGTFITTPVVMPPGYITAPGIILTNISIDSIKFICSTFDYSHKLSVQNVEKAETNISKINKNQLIPTKYIEELKTKFLNIFRGNITEIMPTNLQMILYDPEAPISESIATIMTIAEWVSKNNERVIVPHGGKLIKPVFFEKREISGRLRNIYKQGTKLVIKHNGVFIKLSEYKALIKKKK